MDTLKSQQRIDAELEIATCAGVSITIIWELGEVPMSAADRAILAVMEHRARHPECQKIAYN